MIVDRLKLKEQYKKELYIFEETRPKSKALHQKARECLLTSAPLNWMNYWAGNFRIYVNTAKGTRVTDVDGNEYIDFCLGDTGAMTGHSPDASIDVICEKMRTAGTSTMLPNEDHIWVAKEMERRFGLPRWQFALSASDANRFSIRWARYATERKKVLVFNHCYHGSVDETLAQLWDGEVGEKVGSIGNALNLKETTKIVEFNDIEAVKKALEPRDVAIILTEPALTNMGIVLPAPGFLQELEKISKETGTVLLIDETHTISQGIGGFTREYNLNPDIVVMGKPIASGIPAAIYGFSKELAERIEAKYPHPQEVDMMGIGTTLTGNAITVAAIRATLENVLTEEAYEHMFRMSARYQEGVDQIFKELDLKWSTIRIGARVEYWFNEGIPQQGSDVYDSFHDDELHKYIHLALLNRGIIIAPVHNMALMCPVTSEADVDKHTSAFREVLINILS